MRVAVIRSEMGRVVESMVLEGSVYDVVKDITRHVMDEWDPGRSDFLVMRDNRKVTILGEPDEAALRELEAEGRVERLPNAVEVYLPIFVISFDNEFLDEEDYVDNKVYVIAPLVADGLREEMEVYAAELTVRKERPEGIEER